MPPSAEIRRACLEKIEVLLEYENHNAETRAESIEKLLSVKRQFEKARLLCEETENTPAPVLSVSQFLREYPGEDKEQVRQIVEEVVSIRQTSSTRQEISRVKKDDVEFSAGRDPAEREATPEDRKVTPQSTLRYEPRPYGASTRRFRSGIDFTPSAVDRTPSSSTPTDLEGRDESNFVRPRSLAEAAESSSSWQPYAQSSPFTRLPK